jgi:hypothetical protein
MESSRQYPVPHDLSVLEEQESRIVFLEWKASSDARVNREKMSDLTWKIESLQKEVETLNHDRACLKMEIVRLEATLFSAEEGLNIAQASQATHERLKRECSDRLKEICELKDQNRILQTEQAEFSRLTASKYLHLSDALCEMIRDCNIISENISKVVNTELSYQSSIVSMKSRLTALRDTSIYCMVEVTDIRNEISKASSLYGDVAEGLKDIVNLSIAAKDESKFALERAKLDCTESEILKQKLSSFRHGVCTALNDCIESRRELDQLCQYMLSFSGISGALQQLVYDCKAGDTIFQEIKTESLNNDDHLNEMYTSASEIASRMHMYLCRLNLPSASSGLSQSVQCLKSIVQRINGTYSPHDESLSELSTVWADHDMSMRSLSQPSQSETLIQYLQGMTRPRSGCGMCMLAGKIYFAGGTDGQCAWDDIEYFDLSNKKWGVASKMPSARICFQLMTIREKLVALGGEDAEGRVLASCIEYDPKTDSWAELSPMNNCRTGFGALYLHSEGLIVVSGGKLLNL